MATTRSALCTGDRYRPTTDIRVSPREILAPQEGDRPADDPFCLMIRYRTFDDGRGIPLVRRCTIYTFWRWIERWKAKKLWRYKVDARDLCCAQAVLPALREIHRGIREASAS